MKTVEQWFQTLPENLRKLATDAVINNDTSDAYSGLNFEVPSFADAIKQCVNPYTPCSENNNYWYKLINSKNRPRLIAKYEVELIAKKCKEYKFGYSDGNRIKYALKANVFTKLEDGEEEYYISFELFADKVKVYYSTCDIHYNNIAPSKDIVLRMCLMSYSKNITQLTMEMLQTCSGNDSEHKFEQYR